MDANPIRTEALIGNNPSSSYQEMWHARRAIGTATIALALFVVIAAGATGFVLLTLQSGVSNHTDSYKVTNRTFYDDYIVTSNASQYLPNGYYSQGVNITHLRSGNVIKLGSLSFRFEVPPTETRSGGVITMIDYICPSFFHAVFSNGSEFTLEYCTPMDQANRTDYVTTSVTTASSTVNEIHSTGIQWSKWELSRNTTPRVGIHVEGVGDQVTFLELVVAK